MHTYTHVYTQKGRHTSCESGWLKWWLIFVCIPLQAGWLWVIYHTLNGCWRGCFMDITGNSPEIIKHHPRIPKNMPCSRPVSSPLDDQYPWGNSHTPEAGSRRPSFSPFGRLDEGPIGTQVTNKARRTPQKVVGWLKFWFIENLQGGAPEGWLSCLTTSTSRLCARYNMI